MTGLSVRSMDPKKAPTKTAQDLVDTVKRLCTTNSIIEFGVTLGSLQAALRCDSDRLKALMKGGTKANHFREEYPRFFPEPSLQYASAKELFGPVTFKIYIFDGKWRFRCSWCGTSHRKFETKSEVLAYLDTEHHLTLQAHSLLRSRVVA